MKALSVRAKILTAFTVVSLICTLGISFLALTVFWQRFSRVTGAYLNDVTMQSTVNMKKELTDIEDMNVRILSSSTVQEQLRRVNAGKSTSFQLRGIRETILRELEQITLFGGSSISLSVFSLDGTEFTVHRVTGKPVQRIFPEDEIYEANGSTLWGLVPDTQDICVSKAILDLNTMMPLGYMNIVYSNTFFREIIENRASEYSCSSYLLDNSGQIISTNREEMTGSEFPVFAGLQETEAPLGQDIIYGERSFLYEGDLLPNGWTIVETVSVREFYKNITQIIGIILLIACAFLTIGLLVIWRVTGRVLQPTQDLLRSMQQFGQGDLTCRVEIRSNDEVGLIGKEYNAMADNIEHLIRQVYEMELAGKQSELDFLRMQINPHFLYNTLDTIGWLAFAGETDQISEVVVALAELLRAMVKSERFISIEEEMHSVRDYLLIQERRFGDRISVEYELDPSVMQYKIPNFILQPLIENAIIHGLEPKVDKGRILIRITDAGNVIHFSVQDDGTGMNSEEIEQLIEACSSADTKKSIGLKNVYRRLLLCYGETGRPVITSEPQHGTRIDFDVPK